MATRYDANTPHPARIALTSFNPFSPNFDHNAALTAAKAWSQSSTSAAAVTTLRTAHAVVVRNNSVPHTQRGNPASNAAPGTNSSPLRISTHLFHNTADVDNLVTRLQLTVPLPSIRGR